MTREQLEHAIRAACDVAEDAELLIFGSQAILGQFPDAPSTLRVDRSRSPVCPGMDSCKLDQAR